MNLASLLILLLVAAALFFALRAALRPGRAGSCGCAASGGCACHSGDSS